MDPNSILKSLKEASPFDIFLISFLLLPVVVDAWINIMMYMTFEQRKIDFGIAAVILAYIIGIFLMYTGSSRTRNREIARDEIIQYLRSKDFEIMSFERVRKNINSSYSNEFLLSTIQHFPDNLRRAKLGGSKLGVGRIIEVETHADEG